MTSVSTRRQGRDIAADSGRRPAWLLFLAGAVLATLLYGLAFDNGFREDDFEYLAAAANSRGSAVLAPHAEIPFYRPGGFTLFWAEYGVFGLAGGRYLIFSYVLHLLTALAAWALFARLGLRRAAAALGAGLFLLGLGHYGKQVMWACTSGSLMAVLLSVLAMLAWTAHLERERGGGWLLATGAGLAAGLAPTFHECGLMAPVLLGLLAVYLRGGRRLLRADALAVTALPLLAWVFLVLLRSGGHALGQPLAVLRRLILYPGMALLPLQPSDSVVGLTPWMGRLGHLVAAAHLVLGALVIGWIIFAHVRRLPSGIRLLSIWILVALAPYALVPLPAGWLELRYLYFAAVPISGLMAAGLVWLASGSRLRWAVSVGLGLGLAVMTVAATAVLERSYDRKGRDQLNLERLEQVRALVDRHDSTRR
jgi:hypothetical protein